MFPPLPEDFFDDDEPIIPPEFDYLGRFDVNEDGDIIADVYYDATAHDGETFDDIYSQVENAIQDILEEPGFDNLDHFSGFGDFNSVPPEEMRGPFPSYDDAREYQIEAGFLEEWGEIYYDDYLDIWYIDLSEYEPDGS